MKGLNLMDKMLFVRGARIAFKIWDVGGICGLLLLLTFAPFLSGIINFSKCVVGLMQAIEGLLIKYPLLAKMQ